MKVVFNSFGGIVPRSPEHNFGHATALVAHDVKLRNGIIEAWRETQCIAHFELPDVLTFHMHGCCPVGWQEVVNVAEVSPDWERFFISGRSSGLESVVMSADSTHRHCCPTYYKLGVPPSPVRPAVSGTECCDRDADARSYVYTYINQWYEESAPSPASAVIRPRDGDPVTVYNIAAAPSGYNIIGVNIYRATTGFRVADGKQQEMATDYLYVDTVLYSTDKDGNPVYTTLTYVDKKKVVDLGPVLETEHVRMPPSCLTNLCSIEGMVRLAATSGNKVCLSENLQPHNWPVKYELTLDSNIRHMGCIEQKLFVTTDTTPYIIDVSGCDATKCTPVLDLQRPLPDIGCGHASAAITTPHGYVYTSPIGSILIEPNGKWHVLTARWFSEDDWRKIQPTSIRYGYYQGFLFIISNAVSFLLDIDGDPYGDMDQTELSTISDKPVDLKTSPTGKMLLLEDNSIKVWNEADEYRKYLWVSRELTGGENDHVQMTDGKYKRTIPLGNMWSPASAKIRTEGVHFRLDTSRGTVYERDVSSEAPFRLPRIGRHMWYHVRLEGILPVEFLELGTAHFTVNAGA